MTLDETAAGSGDDVTPPVGDLHTSRRPAASLLTFGTVALVLLIVIVLVVVKVTGTSTIATSPATSTPSPATSTVVHAVTHIPASVFDTVGTSSSVAAVALPSILRGQPALTSGGKPEVVFVGEEFSPYSAAERWALVAALARFGTFHTLDAMQSASNELFAGTPTFTFYRSRYESPYLSTALVERYSNQKNGAGTGFAALQSLTGREDGLLARYGETVAGKGATPVLPFLDVANKAVVSGASFSPSIFEELNATDIASGLTDAKDPATQAIVAAANELSAVICSADGGRPGRVCASPGVTVGARALGLKP